jgi:SHS2 domain-containing protein
VQTSSGYEIREHMADIIVRAWGDSLGALFEQAALGFYAVIGELAWTPGESVDLRLEAAHVDDLLHDYVAELLFIFETQHAILAHRRYAVLTETRLELAAQRCPLDAERSVFHREVKAVTYHGLHVMRQNGGYSAEIILDI